MGMRDGLWEKEQDPLKILKFVVSHTYGKSNGTGKSARRINLKGNL
jgi:hypothetical protein